MNEGRLFASNKKLRQTDVDYFGEIVVNKVEYVISGWDRTSTKGNKYIKLLLREKKIQTEQNTVELAAEPAVEP